MKKILIILVVLGLLIISIFLVDFRVFFKQTCLEACNEKGFSNAQCGKYGAPIALDVDKERGVINGTIPCKFEAWIPVVEEGKRIPYNLEDFSDCHNEKSFGRQLLGIFFTRFGEARNICCCS